MVKINNIHYLHDINNGVELIICDNSTISYPLHNHVSVFTIGMVLEGSILLNVNCHSQVYVKDQTFVILPYMPHSIKGNDNYTLLSLCIHKNALNSRDCDMDKIKVEIVNLLISALGSDKISQSQIIQLISCLYSFSYNTIADSLPVNTPLIDDLKQRIELFPENKFSVEEMAQAAFTSKYHFIRSFKKEIGLTPHQFQLQNRIRKAQRLIRKADTITEVALTTGFCDQSHFIKNFKNYVGLTPTAYKMSCGLFNSNSID